MEDDFVEMHAILRGRVQGVAFRATARYHAIKLGLKGTVKNLLDGTVEIYAQGKKGVLDQLLRDLQEENGMIRIDSVVTDFYVPIKEFNDFEIAF